MFLTNKVALVTGASRGLGEAIVNRLVKEGATVIGTATTQQGADSITHRLKEQKNEGKGFVLDVARQESIDALMAEIQSTYSAPVILVNNAGITMDDLVLRMGNDKWHQVIETNLTSVYRLSKSCLKGMLKARWGRIINMGSVIGVCGRAGQTNYAAAKAGMIGFSKSLAQEIASRHITVNVIAPGFIETDMTRALNDEQRASILNQIPMGYIGKTEDVAGVVAFLASPDACYITGTTIHVNGGMYMV
jgi:3-oxoacyl-[acyl-carrier protein] reductase